MISFDFSLDFQLEAFEVPLIVKTKYYLYDDKLGDIEEGTKFIALAKVTYSSSFYVIFDCDEIEAVTLSEDDFEIIGTLNDLPGMQQEI